jgi:riboflavin biosynthesis pyrimidine reductase
MRDFQVLFDHGEPSELQDQTMAIYGNLGFPPPVAGKPWIYANFVQTLDGIVSLLGDEASGADISGSPEDRWLMDLLRAHADAVILGMGTLREEQRLGRPRARGPVFRIVDPALQQLRAKLHRGRERNVLVTAHADFQMSDYAVFDGDQVDVTVLTTEDSARKLEAQNNPAVDILALAPAPNAPSGGVDLRQAVAALERRHGIRYLLCEGGPSLYTALLTAGLIDEHFVTISPIQVGRMSPDGPRPSMLPGVGFTQKDAIPWHWLSCRKVGDHQFHRFRRKLPGVC